VTLQEAVTMLETWDKQAGELIADYNHVVSAVEAAASPLGMFRPARLEWAPVEVCRVDGAWKAHRKGIGVAGHSPNWTGPTLPSVVRQAAQDVEPAIVDLRNKVTLAKAALEALRAK